MGAFWAYFLDFFGIPQAVRAVHAWTGERRVRGAVAAPVRAGHCSRLRRG